MAYKININWLYYIAEQISLNNVTLAEAANQAHFDSCFGTYIDHISPSCLRSHFAAHGIVYTANNGRKKEDVPIELEYAIRSLVQNLNCGEKVAFYTLLFTYPSITFTHVRKTFQKYKLYKYKLPQQKEKPRCRYEAKYVNQIWHADIHYFQKPGMDHVMYLYCIIDDRSRFVIHYDLLSEKTAKACAKVLKEAIQRYGPPCMMWTDNGGENKGQFMLNFLKENKIYPVFTMPGNPQQNGKIERFWQKLEDNTRCKEDIPNYIYQYNMIRASMALRCGTRYLRPMDVFYNTDLQWKRGYEWKWFVDGKEMIFPYDAERKAFYFD